MIDERYPAAFLNECHEILKEEFPAFLRALALPPRRALRLNPQRIGAEQAAAPFLPADAPRIPWEPLGRYLAPDSKPGAGIAHAAGAFYLQDASAMAPVASLDPQPGERVLDLCAAPGGKSGQIAARLNGRGFLLSNEIEFSRARILLGNLERLGVTNAFVTSASAETLARALPAFFDRVLVDAPCSGEGMFRRDPEAAAQWNPDAPAGCAARQTAILNDAARMVRPGGRLVYSTCTFNRLENEDVVREFLRTHPDFAPDTFELPGIGASQDGCLRLWPHRIEGEGHFLARLTRRPDTSAPTTRACARRSTTLSESISIPAPTSESTSAPGNCMTTGEICAECVTVSSSNALTNDARTECVATHERDAESISRTSTRESRAELERPSARAKSRREELCGASSPKGRAAHVTRGKASPAPDLSEFVRALPEGEIVVDGDEVRLISALAPDPASLTGVRVLRAGLPLATLGRSHVEPAHALAMALTPETARQTIELTDEQAAAYLAGEALPTTAPSGWTLAAWHSLPLGWSKITGGTLKNHLPKGLRKRN